MISVFLFLLVFPFFSQADSCADWFNKTNISPVDKNCKSLCRVSQSDMSTFSCNQQCDEFCQDPCKKKLNELEKFISHSKPKVWRDTEKLTPWKKIEKKLIIESLSKMPDKLINIKDLKIFRLEKSTNYPNPASSTAEIASGPYTALYNSLFGPHFNVDKVILHELAHFYYQRLDEETIKSYLLATNWFMKKNGKGVLSQRVNGYVQEDGQAGPEEDFANNLEFFILKKNTLQKTYEPAFNWIKSHFTHIEMQQGCTYE